MKTVSLSFIFVLVLLLNCAGKQSGDPTFADEVKRHVLIGQAYPSGNAYLKPFLDRNGTLEEWPQEVVLIPLTDEGQVSKDTLLTAFHSSTMESDIENNRRLSAYIPAIEGMDQQHGLCGLEDETEKNDSYAYLSEDFFHAMADHCEPNDGVGLYTTTSSNYSYMTWGISSKLNLERVTPVSGHRSLTAVEEVEVQEARDEIDRSDCTTKPAHLDAANQIIEVSLRSGVALRLSSYQDPGCYGHLNTTYVLDVLRGDDVADTYLLTQYHGRL